MDKINKEKKIENEVDRILRWFSDNFDSEVVLDPEFRYVVRIKEFNPFIEDILREMQIQTSEEVKKKLEKRIRSYSSRVNYILKQYFFKRVPSIVESVMGYKFA